MVKDFKDTSPFRGVIQFSVGRYTFRAVREGIAIGVYERVAGDFVRCATVRCALRPRAVYDALRLV
jgi:hypothetical protein